MSGQCGENCAVYQGGRAFKSHFDYRVSPQVKCCFKKGNRRSRVISILVNVMMSPTSKGIAHSADRIRVEIFFVYWIFQV